MTVRAKLLSLLAGFAVVFIAVSFLTYSYREREMARFLSLYQTEKIGLFDRIEALQSDTLEALVYDYSWWDEMVEFVETVDPEWSYTNLEDTLDEIFNADFGWVLDPDMNPVYTLDERTNETGIKLPVSKEALREHLQEKPFQRFFVQNEESFIEVRTAPIHDSAEEDRETAPTMGYFLVGRLWDEEYLEALSELTESQLEVLPAEEVTSEAADSHFGEGYFEFVKLFKGLDGKPVMAVNGRYDYTELVKQVAAYSKMQVMFMVIFIAVMALALAYFLRLWVVMPLGRISGSLATGETGPLEEFKDAKTEFGGFARLIGQFFEQREELNQEIVVRREAEEALTATEKELRDFLKERDQLGRNLHDGLIQSIYAIGLQLQFASMQVEKNPERTREELKNVSKDINRLIDDVRNFILGMEPEGLKGKSLGTALKSIADTMRKVHGCEIILEVEEEIDQHLERENAVNLFHIGHELISNSLRHGEPKEVTCRIYRQDEAVKLEVSNDGSGFDFEAALTEGNGLRNVQSRANEMGAALEASTAIAGRVTIAVSVPLRSEVGVAQG